MNVELFIKHQNTSYNHAKTMLRESHKQVMAIIDTFTNDELFKKKFHGLVQLHLVVTAFLQQLVTISGQSRKLSYTLKQ